MLLHMLAVLLAAVLVRGCMDGLRWKGWRSFLFRSGAWSGVVGGGTYGIALLDSHLFPDWSWGSLLSCIVGTLCLVVAVEMARRLGLLAPDEY